MVKKIKDQKGQSLFEFLVFLPLLVMLIGVFYSFGSAINMTINQQKAVRGYFYHLLKGNSYGINFPDLTYMSGLGIKRVGMFSIGWRLDEANGGKQSFGSCIKVTNIFAGSDSEECKDSTRNIEGSSRYIRAFTMYGVCGNSFVESNGSFYISEDPSGAGRSNQIKFEDCTLSK